MMTNLRKWLATFVVVAVATTTTFAVGFGVGYYVFPSHRARALEASQEYQAEFQLFWEAWSVVAEQFYHQDPLDTREMIHGAIRGMVSTLGDRHTSFLEPSQATIFREDLEGEFGGIGATVGLTEDGSLRVSKPLPGSPAEAAGLQSGDIILEVDGQAVRGMDLVQAISLIRGPRDTEVELLIQREGRDAKLFSIRRQQITVPITEARELEEGIAYLALWECNGRAPAEVEERLQELMEAGPKGLILDLRGNPGGFLYVAVDVASQFLDSGLILTERGTEGQETRHEAKPGGLATDVPLAVLVDAGTASAAEIIAGAIQDRARGIVIGSTTFGKGSVQTTERLSDGSALQVTIRRWYTPNGQEIHGRGLVPDIQVDLTEDDLASGRDPQLEKATSYLQSTGRT